MDGIEFAKQLRARNATLPVLFVSGFSEEPLGKDNLPVHARFLPKPFEARELFKNVRHLLDKPSKPSKPSLPRRG
jgi:DNA-binding response OmpR family regulator